MCRKVNGIKGTRRKVDMKDKREQEAGQGFGRQDGSKNKKGKRRFGRRRRRRWRSKKTCKLKVEQDRCKTKGLPVIRNNEKGRKRRI